VSPVRISAKLKIYSPASKEPTFMTMHTMTWTGSLRKRLIGVACGFAGMLTLLGCSAGPMQLVGDEDEARTVLTQALDVWQAGHKPDSLKQEQPVVHVADEDWQAGKTLKGYEVTGEPQEAGGHWRVSALLTLWADGESESKKNVAYAVTLEPAITILRADDVPE
jgi:hypothetical protein